MTDEQGKSNDRSEADHGEAILRLYSQHQRWLFGYLTSLLGNANDAEDVMQEVSVIMWQQHQKFTLGTSFISWLSVIAYHQVQRFWREQKKREPFLQGDVADQISLRVSDQFDLLEARRQALAICVRELSNSDRELVDQCYSSRKQSLKKSAQQVGRPVGTVYKALNRIRRSLLACINRKVQAEGLA